MVTREGSIRPRVTDWRLTVESRAARARTDLGALGPADPGDPEGAQWRRAAAESLDIVDAVLNRFDRWWRSAASWWSGWHIERAWRALHEAEISIIAAGGDLSGRLPGLRARVAAYLPEDDLRRQALEELSPGEFPLATVRVVVVDAVRAAFDNSDGAHAAARALRNKLVVASIVLLLFNVAIGVVGSLRAGLVPLCVHPPSMLSTCPGGLRPSPGDVWLVQLLGAFGAIIATVISLLRRRPSLAPYVLIGYQALIKALLGAALSVVGVLALAAGVTEGLIGISTQPALQLWAVLLGYSQQIGTRLLDNYADHVMEQARPMPETEAPR
ncbi:hypothetical protein F0L68_08760 [Solihabitans fulvus]|uniref:Uncharacterized protein n=1 Tax=Solihabitans fulvus TaxID=1892852 RepID=A0A5B2XLS2_9PSEU|nr:hypothetical protein [Solihabitans fulvus]KAA2264065.1 hypothetical protein F0L68_08760 [Solihabitans fulvus]